MAPGKNVLTEQENASAFSSILFNECHINWTEPAQHTPGFWSKTSNKYDCVIDLCKE